MPADGNHWSAPDHIFSETTDVGVSEAKSDYDYNYKTDFHIWNENKEFECQDISVSQIPFNSTHIGTNTSDAKISPLDSTPVGRKTSYPKY